MNRSARAHKSTKIPNVKLRPAPAPVQQSERDSFDGNGYVNAKAGPSSRGRRRLQEDVGLSAIDRRRIEEMEAEDGVVDTDNRESYNHSQSQLPFHGQVLSFTSVSADEKSHLTPKLQAMGISSIQSSLTTDCTILISRSFDSPKYFCALECRMAVFTPELIDEVHQRYIGGEEVSDIMGKDWEGFRLRAFEGLKIAVTGIEPISRRQEIIDLIKTHGGSYSKNLDRSCTHLIVANPEMNPKESQSDPRKSAKVAFALGLPAEEAQDEEGNLVAAGPRVIWEGWLWDCVEFDGRWKEEGWDLRQHWDPPRFSTSRAGKARRERERKEVDAAQELLNAVVVADENLPALITRMDSDAPLTEPIPAAELEPARPRRGAITTSHPLPSTRGKTDLLDELLNSLGPRPTVSPPMDAREAAAAEEPSNRRRSKLMAVETTMDAPFKTGPPIRASMLHATRMDAFAAPISPVDHLEGNRNLSVPPIATGSSVGTALPPTAPPQSSANAPEYVTPDLFKGLTFCNGVREGQDGHEQKIVLEGCLRDCGAVLLTEQERLEGAKVDYLVVRLTSFSVLPPHISSDTQVITECWVERCMYRRQIVSPDENIVMRPLVQPMPLEGAARFSIHLTGFDEENVFYHKRLIRAMGADYALSFSRKRTTHLLYNSSAPPGPKVSKAAEWKIPVIRKEWLIDSVSRGSVLPFEEYVYRLTPGTAAVLPSASNPKTPLIADATTANNTNLSILASNPLLGQTHPPPDYSKENVIAPSDSIDSNRKASSSQKSSSESRRLGLKPTEVNIPQVAASALGAGAIGSAGGEGKVGQRSMVEDSVMDIDMEMDLPVGGNSAMTTTATNGQQAQIQPPRTEKSRPPARMASGVTAGEVGGGGIAKPFLTSELIRELERGDVGAQTRQARGVRRPRTSGRSTNPFARPAVPSASSRLFSLAPADGPDISTENSNMNNNDDDDGADQSMRVMYADPNAERERKRLLDAFDNKKSKKARVG